ncbi:MAG: DUF839 domain-containing protein [Candidatus Scalindua sp.]|nr:DUF839 domain-containing protein [Candidatus Scalindua sp.]
MNKTVTSRSRMFFFTVIIAIVQIFYCLPSFAVQCKLKKLSHFGVQFKTNKPPQMRGDTPTTSNGWKVTPLVTIGDTNGSGKDINEKHLGYRPPGRLDGIGAFKIDNRTVRVLVSHELSADDGYAYKLANGTQLTGARVSSFDIDAITRKVTAAGIAYDAVYDRAGETVTDPAQIREGQGDNIDGFAFLCSAYGINTGEFGFVDDIFFTGEEVGGAIGGQQAAIDVDKRDIYIVPMIGRAAHENACPIDPGDSDKVVLMIGDDRRGAPLLLYIGQKGTEQPNDSTYNPPDFLNRNGLGLGNLYVLVFDDSSIKDPGDFYGTFNMKSGKFVKIEHFNPAKAAMNNYDSMGFANLMLQDSLADAVGAFMFSRPEDLSVNPNNGTQVVMASTGFSGSFGGADSWGTTYLIDVHLGDILNEDLVDINYIPVTVEIIYDGDNNNQFANPDDGLRSPDNLDWASNGYIYIQEDEAIPSFGQTNNIEASVWQLNPINGQLVRVLEMDRSAVPLSQIDLDPSDIGDWESSGILDVTGLFKTKKKEQVFILDVQAHSLKGLPIDGVLVPAGATWKYLDNGSDQGTAWKEFSFDDTGWSAGPAELGYGDGDEETAVSFGPNTSNKFITTYFRHSFDIVNASKIRNLILKILRDDGAVVYLNGTEILRSNMPAETITYNTFASQDTPDENIFFENSVDTDFLKDGENVLAVEIHQGSSSSSDISFNLQLDIGYDPGLVEGGQLLLMTKKN